MQLSYWERDSFFNRLDVSIIGSGIVGLSAALHLKEQHPDWRVAIFERGVLPSGASTRNAGFACFGSISELVADVAHHGMDEVLALVEKRWRGLERLKARVGVKRLQLQMHGGYELFMPYEKASFKVYCEQLPLFNEALLPIVGRQSTFSVSDEKIKAFGLANVQHLIYNAAEGQIHTGEMMKSLIEQARDRGVSIFNGVELEGMESNRSEVLLQLRAAGASRATWELPTEKVLIATNGFVNTLLKDLPVQPARNQVLITKPIEGLKIKGTFHYDEGYYYFRNVGNRVLLGGARNIDEANEMTHQFGLTETIQQALVKMLREVILPDIDFEVEQWWSGILGVGPNKKKPIVQLINDRVAVAVRMGGMGVAIGSLVGEEGAALLC